MASLAFALAAGTAAAESPHPCLRGTPEIHVVQSVSTGGDVIAENGTVLRVIGAASPDAGTYLKLLRDHLSGESVAVYGFGTDRYQRQMAHILLNAREEAPDGAPLWLQELLIEDGHTIVHHQPEAGACAQHLLSKERTARAERKGLWARPRHHILDANDSEEAERAIGAYRILEGEVLRVATVGGTTYLNFESDWRSDMTLAANARAVRRFTAKGIDLHALEKKRIRMRGFLIYRNGPMIELAYPEQLEFPVADPVREAEKTD